MEDKYPELINMQNRYDWHQRYDSMAMRTASC